jgi:HAD superfamily hydrolase (TIGR01549 family)
VNHHEPVELGCPRGMREGTRATRGGTASGPPTSPSGCPDLNWGPLRPERSALPGCATPRGCEAYRTGARILGDVLKAVLLDVDFTLSRPGPELGPEGYVRIAARHGLTLDTAHYDTARLDALANLQRHPDLVHDEELWVAFTEEIVLGMGGSGTAARRCALEVVREWERHENFFLYEDALPALAALKARNLRIGLVSNGQRDLEEFACHHSLDVDVCVGSLRHGRLKPHRSIFEAALAALDAAPEEAAMVGDSYEDDIEGARALGMRAILVDRDGLHVDEPDRIDTLLALPAALGLAPT